MPRQAKIPAGRAACARTGRPRRWRAQPDRGSVTIEQLMWGLFWLAAITAAGLVVGPWIVGKVNSIIGY